MIAGLALSAELFAVALVFARIGAALMVLPVFGESYVPARQRLLLALLVSALLAAPLRPGLVPPPEAASAALLLIQEIGFGLCLGLAARLLLLALHFAGEAMATSAGLAAAAIFDPNQSASSGDVSRLMTMAALLLILLADGHLWLLEALAASYHVQAVGAPFAVEEAGPLLARLSADALTLGLRLAAPVLLVSLLFNLAMGVLSRLVPSLQVFFVAVPAQLLLLLGVIALGAGAAVMGALDFLEHSLAWIG